MLELKKYPWKAQNDQITPKTQKKNLEVFYYYILVILMSKIKFFSMCNFIN